MQTRLSRMTLIHPEGRSTGFQACDASPLEIRVSVFIFVHSRFILNVSLQVSQQSPAEFTEWHPSKFTCNISNR